MGHSSRYSDSRRVTPLTVGATDLEKGGDPLPYESTIFELDSKHLMNFFPHWRSSPVAFMCSHGWSRGRNRQLSRCFVNGLRTRASSGKRFAKQQRVGILMGDDNVRETDETEEVMVPIPPAAPTVSMYLALRNAVLESGEEKHIELAKNNQFLQKLDRYVEEQAKLGNYIVPVSDEERDAYVAEMRAYHDAVWDKAISMGDNAGDS